MPRNIITLGAAILAAIGLSTGVLSSSAFADEGKPQVIRLGFPGVGTGNRPIVGGAVLSTVELQGLLEEEFKKDGIKIEWDHFQFAGPAINEAFANNLLDFAYEGDLAMIVGRGAGLHTKVLAGAAERTPIAIAVPSDSQIKTLADLRGKRFAVAKGTAIQLAAARVLAKAGLTEKDVREVNILGANATDALATKDIDAVISMPSSFYPLRDRGVARIIFESRESDLSIASGFLGTDEFIKKYPDITKRILKVYLKAAAYTTDDKNRDSVFRLWGQDGTGYGYYKEQFKGASLAEDDTPLLDDYWKGRFKDGIADSLKYNLLRKDFDLNAWLDASLLNAAVKETGLENHWHPYAYDGKPEK